MHTSDEIKKQLSELLKEQGELLKLARGKNEQVLEFNDHYQRWYTRASKLVELLGPDRLTEFVGYYRVDPKRKRLDAETFVIQDFIKGIGPAANAYGEKPFDETNVVLIRLFNQTSILAALDTRINSVLADVTGHLLAELQDSELEAASKLIKVNLRAAGALAGVVLERHLQRVAINHKVTIPKKSPTVSDLNDPLKEKGIYDIPTWRKIQLLADIRNICSHQKATEPTEEQVKELLSGVGAIIKTVF